MKTLKKILEKRNYIILFIIIVLFIWILFFNKKEIYLKSFNYFNETITYKIYDNIDKNKVTKDINNIYKKYTNYNKKLNQKKLNENMNSLLEYGKLLYYNTNGYIDITSGDLLENIKNNKEYTFTSKIDKIGKENINYNFENIISAYATNDVIYYFKQNNIKKYIVNQDGDITVGKRYDKNKYKISLLDNEKVMSILKLENKAVATRKNDSFKSYMVNPKTSKKEEKYDMVVVIANDNLTANMIANTLYLMDIDSGKEFIKKYNVSVLWKTNNETYQTDNFKNYISN